MVDIETKSTGCIYIRNGQLEYNQATLTELQAIDLTPDNVTFAIHEQEHKPLPPMMLYDQMNTESRGSTLRIDPHAGVVSRSLLCSQWYRSDIFTSILVLNRRIRQSDSTNLPPDVPFSTLPHEAISSTLDGCELKVRKP